jgi:hypothetical protein
LVAVKHQPECDDISVSNTEPQVDTVERFLLKLPKLSKFCQQCA